MRSLAIVLAAGSGSRMGSDIKKQYLLLNNKPIMYYSLKTFEKSTVDDIILVVPGEDAEYCKNDIVLKYDIKKIRDIVPGGKDRYLSVEAAFASIADNNYDIVLIHDAARPFVSVEMVEEAVREALIHKSYIPGIAVKDTIKQKDDDSFVESTLERAKLVAVQTPQAFDFKLCKKAYELLRSGDKLNFVPTDDEMLVYELMGIHAKVGEGSIYNIKVTTKEDMYMAKRIADILDLE